MKINKIWFDHQYIYGIDENGIEYKQSLLWYPELNEASMWEKQQFHIGFKGIHWRNLDVDISFDSFKDDDAEPSPLQCFFLKHREIKLSEFSKRIGIDATLLRNYINGFKKPSEKREQEILAGIHRLASEYAAATF